MQMQLPRYGNIRAYFRFIVGLAPRVLLFGRRAVLAEPAPLRHDGVQVQPGTVGVRGRITEVAENHQLVVLAEVADVAGGVDPRPS
jgi:hypothetical protein